MFKASWGGGEGGVACLFSGTSITAAHIFGYKVKNISMSISLVSSELVDNLQQQLLQVLSVQVHRLAQQAVEEIIKRSGGARPNLQASKTHCIPLSEQNA